MPATRDKDAESLVAACWVLVLGRRLAKPRVDRAMLEGTAITRCATIMRRMLERIGC